MRSVGDAAQWARYFVRDEDVRQGMAQCMADTLLPFVAKPNSRCYAAARRSGVTMRRTSGPITDG